MHFETWSPSPFLVVPVVPNDTLENERCLACETQNNAATRASRFSWSPGVLAVSVSTVPGETSTEKYPLVERRPDFSSGNGAWRSSVIRGTAYTPYTVQTFGCAWVCLVCLGYDEANHPPKEVSGRLCPPNLTMPVQHLSESGGSRRSFLQGRIRQRQAINA